MSNEREVDLERDLIRQTALVAYWRACFEESECRQRVYNLPEPANAVQERILDVRERALENASAAVTEALRVCTELGVVPS